MTTADLVAKVAQEAALTKRQAATVLRIFMEQMQAALSRGERSTLVGFGTFAVRMRAARTGRNPRTGQEVVIAARKMPTFRASTRLREAVR
jgi:DNA-binding protein HU-beta